MSPNMDRTLFKQPVSILVGLGDPAKVESASQAYQLLNELPLTANPVRSVAAARVCKLPFGNDGKSYSVNHANGIDPFGFCGAVR